MKKKRKTKYFIVAVALVLVITGTISAYLKESDSIYNLFTIGRAKVSIDEGEFEQEQIISPTETIEKAPTVKNDGSIEEYVFAVVSMPMKEISVFDDVTKKPDYDPTTNITKLQSVFEVGVKAPHTEGNVSETVGGQTVNYDYFKYNTTEENGGKWVFLKTTDTAANGSNPAYKNFLFGYSAAIKPDTNTGTIFDNVTLKNFIEENIEGNTSVEIKVGAFCIQCDNLDTHSYAKTGLDAEKLKDIYTICVNKGLTS